MQFVIDLFELLRRFGAKVGPYVLVELLLPGGTLFALLLFLHQRLKANAGTFSTRLASPPALVSTLYEAPLQCNRVARGSRMIPAFA
jgi:hypothetical protein